MGRSSSAGQQIEKRKEEDDRIQHRAERASGRAEYFPHQQPAKAGGELTEAASDFVVVRRQHLAHRLPFLRQTVEALGAEGADLLLRPGDDGLRDLDRLARDEDEQARQGRDDDEDREDEHERAGDMRAALQSAREAVLHRREKDREDRGEEQRAEIMTDHPHENDGEDQRQRGDEAALQGDPAIGLVHTGLAIRFLCGVSAGAGKRLRPARPVPPGAAFA
jgi:hypothetical protein